MTTTCTHCRSRGAERCTPQSCPLADPEVPYDASWMCRPCWVRLGGLRNHPDSAADQQTSNTPLLGDVVHKALSAVGVTPESLSGWLGKGCNCKDRQEKLNQLDVWARRVVGGRVEQAGEFLRKILGAGN